MLLQDFATKYENVLKDSVFFGYIFAYTTNMLRKNYGTENFFSSFERNLQQILGMGNISKYRYSPLSADAENNDKFLCDIETERGIINVLQCETSPFCHCMYGTFEIGSQKMEKVGICHRWMQSGVSKNSIETL